MRAHDQCSIFSTGRKFRPDYGLLLELHALTLVARSYVLLMHIIWNNRFCTHEQDLHVCQSWGCSKLHASYIVYPGSFSCGKSLGTRIHLICLCHCVPTMKCSCSPKRAEKWC